MKKDITTFFQALCHCYGGKVAEIDREDGNYIE